MGEKKESLLVVKDNDLIQKNRFNLSLQEQKIIAYLCTRIDREQEYKPEDLDVVFDSQEYFGIFGISNSGSNYKDLKRHILELRNQGFYIKTGENKIATASWIKEAEINTKSGKVKVTLDKKLVPYLVNLKNHFFTYELENISKFTSTYSIKLYELFKSWLWAGSEKTFELKYLYDLLGMSKTNKVFSKFESRVLKPSIEEINEKTDLFIKYAVNRIKGTATSIEFTVIKTKSLVVSLEAEAQGKTK